MDKSRMNIVEVDGIIISMDCLREEFCCDIDACGGACCIEGDAGAPVTLDEVAAIEEALPAVIDCLTPEARRIIDEQGVAYIDQEGDLVTSIVGGRDCVFAIRNEHGHCICAIQKAKAEGLVQTEKPISCALYPIRVKQFANGLVGLNYNQWRVCQAARVLGRSQHLPVYRFLREPLERRFGIEWYARLEQTAEELRKDGYLD